MKQFSFFMVLIMVVLSSCVKDNNQEQLFRQNETQSNSNCFGFTKTNLATVGILHNQYVATVYHNVDFLNCDDCSDEILDEFAKIDIDLSSVGKTKNELLLEAKALYLEMESIQFDLRNWASHPFSQQTFIHLSKLMQEMDEMSNYSDFLIEMNNLQLAVDLDGNLTCFELELLTGTIEVAKNSAYLWLPRESGGLDFYAISQAGKVQPRWSWRNAAKSDVAASASYFMGLGIGGAIGLITPGSNAAILGMWGITSGISSALGGCLN